MLFAHKLIDAARGRDPRCKFTVTEGTNPKHARNLITAVEEAEKFDFGQLVFEKKADGQYVLPDLTNDEREMWVQGYLPLPAETCWYEYQLGDIRSALCVLETKEPGSPWMVMRVQQNGDEFVYDGYVCAIKRAEQKPDSDTWSYYGGGNKRISIDTDGGKSVAADVMLSIYLTMMINSRTTDVVTEPAPAKLNKARDRRGQTPLFAHRVVNIVPQRFIRDSERETQGTHASPRLHWRRTHVRTLHRGQPNESKRVIWRFLVGRAERGVVSHEYRVLV